MLCEAAREIVRLTGQCDDPVVRDRGAAFGSLWAAFSDGNMHSLGDVFDLREDGAGWSGRANLDALEGTPYLAIAHWCHWMRQLLGPRNGRIDRLGFFRSRPEWAECSVALFELRLWLEQRHDAPRDAPTWLVDMGRAIVNERSDYGPDQWT
jgi:hypothetical protein